MGGRATPSCPHTLTVSVVVTTTAWCVAMDAPNGGAHRGMAVVPRWHPDASPPVIFRQHRLPGLCRHPAVRHPGHAGSAGLMVGPAHQGSSQQGIRGTRDQAPHPGQMGVPLLMLVTSHTAMPTDLPARGESSTPAQQLIRGSLATHGQPNNNTARHGPARPLGAARRHPALRHGLHRWPGQLAMLGGVSAACWRCWPSPARSTSKPDSSQPTTFTHRLTDIHDDPQWGDPDGPRC